MPTTPPLYLDDLLRERRWLVGLSRHLIASASDAEDVAQEALMRAIEHGDQVPKQARRSWLAATARNIALNTKRGTYRRVSRERWVSRAEVSEELSPGELVAKAEYQACAANAVVALPEADRTIVVLRFYEGLTTAQIAARLDIGPATVRKRLSRAVQRLRTSLDQRDSERPWEAMAGLVIRSTTKGATLGPGPGILVMVAGVLAAVGVAFALWSFTQPSDPNVGAVDVQSADANESEATGVQLFLSDPTQLGGALRDLDSTERLAGLYPDLLQGAKLSDTPEISFAVPTSGVVTLPKSTLSRLPTSATLVVEGYQPVTIDFGAAAGADSIAIELKPRRMIRVTLGASGTQGPPLKQESLLLAATSAAWDPSGRSLSWASFESSLGSGPHLQIARDVKLGDTVELFDVPGSKVWFHLARQGTPSNDPLGLCTLGPFETTNDSVVLGVPVERGSLDPSALRNTGGAARFPLYQTSSLRTNASDDGIGAAVDGAGLLAGFVHTTVMGVSTARLRIPGWRLVRGVGKYGSNSNETATIQRGETRHGFATSLMEQKRRIPSRLVTSDGTEVSSRWRVRYRQGRTIRSATTEPDGSFVMELGGNSPPILTVDPEWCGLGDFASVALEAASGGEPHTYIAPDWQLVDVHVAGLDPTWRLAPTFLKAEREDGATARLFRAGTQGEAAVFRAALPPGRWVVSDGPLVALNDGPIEFSVEDGTSTVRLQAHLAPVDAR